MSDKLTEESLRELGFVLTRAGYRKGRLYLSKDPKGEAWICRIRLSDGLRGGYLPSVYDEEGVRKRYNEVHGATL